MATQTNADVANKVRGIAAERRISQARMAEILTVSRMAIHRRINGSTPFSPEELIKLSQTLETPVGAFFGEVAA